MKSVFYVTCHFLYDKTFLLKKIKLSISFMLNSDYSTLKQTQLFRPVTFNVYHQIPNLIRFGLEISS